MRDAFLRWLDFCCQVHIEPYYEWIPREQNTRADLLSKQVATRYGLAGEVQRFLAEVCELPALLADFNQLAPTLARWAHRRGTYLLVHPVWPAMHNWNQLQKATRRWWALPTADVCLRDESGRAAPPWQMRAAVLDFGPRR